MGFTDRQQIIISFRLDSLKEYSLNDTPFNNIFDIEINVVLVIVGNWIRAPT